MRKTSKDIIFFFPLDKILNKQLKENTLIIIIKKALKFLTQKNHNKCNCIIKQQKQFLTKYVINSFIFCVQIIIYRDLNWRK